MIWLVAIVSGLVAAVAGWFATGALAVWITGLYGMSDFEGQRGMFAFFAVGPIGGLLAMIATVWLVLRIGKGRAPLGRSLARVGTVLAGIAAVVAAAIGVRFLSIDTYTNELPPNLEFEIRIPAAIAVADRAQVEVELHTDKNVGESVFFDPWLRPDGDRRVIAGTVPLRSSDAADSSSRCRSSRSVSLPSWRDPRRDADARRMAAREFRTGRTRHSRRRRRRTIRWSSAIVTVRATAEALSSHVREAERGMLFEEVRSGGCCSYLVACDETCGAVLVDPEISQQDRLLALIAKTGVRPHYVIDTHTHADHFSATRELARTLGVPAVMHRSSVAPYIDLRVDDGETLIGRFQSACCTRQAISRTRCRSYLRSRSQATRAAADRPHRSADWRRGAAREPQAAAARRRPRHPGRTTGHPPTTIGQEKAENPRLQKRDRAAFVEQMHALNLGMPDHLTEALRTNRTGGKTVAQLLDEAARCIAFMSMEEVRDRIGGHERGLVILDIRERDAYDAGHIPGARHVARGQMELLIDKLLPDPTTPVLTCCEFGKISTLAAATLRTMGFTRAVALDGGLKAWREAGYPLEPTSRS